MKGHCTVFIMQDGITGMKQTLNIGLSETTGDSWLLIEGVLSLYREWAMSIFSFFGGGLFFDGF